MPDAETQVYWHELPELQPPWNNNDELQRTIQRSRQLRHCPIAPVDFMLGLTARESRIARRRLAPSERVDRGLVFEPGMTILGAVNALMLHLGKQPLSVEETSNVVEEVSAEYRQAEAETQDTLMLASQHSSLFSSSSTPLPAAAGSTAATSAKEVREAPILRVLESLVPSRNLRMSVLTRRAVQEKGHRVIADDLIFGRKVALLIDRERPVCAAVMCDGKVTTTAVKSCLHLLVPVADPKPWRRRVYSVRGIDRFECLLVYLYHEELDAEGVAAAARQGQVVLEEHRGREQQQEEEEEIRPHRVDYNENYATRDAPRRNDKEEGVETVVSPPLLPKRFGRITSLFPSFDVAGLLESERKRERENVVDQSAEDDDDIEKNSHHHHRHPAVPRGGVDGADEQKKHNSLLQHSHVIASRRRLHKEEEVALPHPVRCNPTLTEQIISTTVGPPVGETSRSKVIRWMEPLEPLTASDVISDFSTVSREAARSTSLSHFGVAMEQAVPMNKRGELHHQYHEERPVSAPTTANPVKLSFPTAADAVQDPFSSLPTISLPSKRRARKDVRHSWTQRLVERERRESLYF